VSGSGRIESVRFLGILESRGRRTVEAELRFADGAVGVGSAPVAIAPGRREHQRSRIPRLGRLDDVAGFAALARFLEARRFDSQAAFDDALVAEPAARDLGADVRLALSLAFWRAAARAAGETPLAALVSLAGLDPALPRPLVNLFSGGIHDPQRALPFQQIMLAADRGDLLANLDAALRLHDALGRRVRDAGRPWQLSASSGYVVPGVDHEELLRTVRQEIDALGLEAASMPLAVDVAAEHLWLDGGGSDGSGGAYRLGSRRLSGEQLFDHLVGLVESYGVGFIEDPFDAAHEDLWRRLGARLGKGCCVVGDDLFATDQRYLDPSLAGGIVLKLNQVGSVTHTLRTARAARAAGMRLCVSHRSGETEDAAMCDLAVAVGAAWIKIGGPRRGDRITKYNQLLRLAAELDTLPAAAGAAGTTASSNR